MTSSGSVRQELFRRLGVFVGGATLSAIEAVCDADLEDLLSLVSKSLVRQAPADGDEPRYWMLETIREFAVEEVASSGERDVLRDRHLAWYAELADTAMRAPATRFGKGLASVELDLANYRAAFTWAAETARPSAAAALATALLSQHHLRGRYAEAEGVARRALALDLDPLDAAALHDRLGVVLRLQGRPREARDSYVEAERILDGVSARDEAWWEHWLDVKLDEAHFFYFQNEQAALDEVVARLEPIIAGRGTLEQQFELLHVRAQRQYRLERYALSESAEELSRRIHVLGLEIGDFTVDFTLGFCLLWRGKPEDAETYFERGLEVARMRGMTLIETRCLVYGLVAKRKRNDVEGARLRLAELELLDELHGYRGLVSANAAWLALRDGRPDLVQRHGKDALADWRIEAGPPSSPFQWTTRFPLLAVDVARAEPDGARDHARAMLDPTQQPLPEEIAAALQSGLDDRDEAFACALELARPGGYV